MAETFEKHLTFVQAIDRPGMGGKSDSQARCLGCPWQSRIYRMPWRAFRDGDDHALMRLRSQFKRFVEDHADCSVTESGQPQPGAAGDRGAEVTG